MIGRVTATLAVLAALAAGGWATATGRLDPLALGSSLIALPLGIQPPELDDPERIRRGAAQYAQVCVTCHGSPANPQRTIAEALRPPAPVLHRRLDNWPDEALFATVKNGVANSGMPAWPAPIREDEVWDMVAFLRHLPTLDAASYRSLTRDDAIAGITGPIRGCQRCHGPQGQGRDGIPRLDFQSRAYLYESLRAFRDGRRASGVMQLATAGLDDATLARLAETFAGDRPIPAPQPASDLPALIALGDPDRKIPPCAACHGATTPVRPEIPRLAGQVPLYLQRQLHLFATHGAQRGGGPLLPLMVEAGHALTPADIALAVEWYGRDAAP